MNNNETERNRSQRKLIGWKAIGRHLGRSERTIQLWESERCLPIHRMPGGRGQGVFAYVDEIDGWMRGDATTSDGGLVEGPTLAPLATPPIVTASIERSIRPPGILVLPFETRGEPSMRGASDALGQRLIARLSAVQPVRVLSWTTSRCVCNGVEALDAIAARLHVRYLVEGAIELGAETTEVEARIVDAELDQVMLADRFVVPTRDLAAAQDRLAEGVALHFALVHEGALVEPMCLTGVTPSGFLDYLNGARCFFEDPDGASGRCLSSLDRALARDPDFVPARTLRGLALLRALDGERDGALAAEVRSIASSCRSETSARVTSAFLNAAIEALRAHGDGSLESAEQRALRWVPPSIASTGRLYERRSPLRPRGGERQDIESNGRPVAQPRPRGQRLFDEWLRTLIVRHRPRDADGRVAAGPIKVAPVPFSCSAGDDDRGRIDHVGRLDGDRPTASSPSAAATTATTPANRSR